MLQLNVCADNFIAVIEVGSFLLRLILHSPSNPIFISPLRCHDRAVALNQLQAMGATLTTSESIMFQLLHTSTHPLFKQSSALLKEVNKLPNEFADSKEL